MLPYRIEGKVVWEEAIAAWEKEVQTKGKERASLFRVILRNNKRDILLTILYMCIGIGFFMLSPAFFISRLINYVGNDEPLWTGIILAIGITLSDAGRSIFGNQYWTNSSNTGLRLKSMMHGKWKKNKGKYCV